MIDCFASEPHYLAHMVPILAALDLSERGTLYLAGRLADEGNDQGLDFTIGYPPPGDTLCLVASFKDSCAVRTRRRPAIYVEHGAGQRYTGSQEVAEHGAYAGGAGHDGTVLFLSPRQEVADRWRTRYPNVPAVAVGTPKLDWWHRNPRTPEGPITVAISFHQDSRVCPESSTAWSAYSEHLAGAVARLRSEGVTVLGHGHPRIFDRLRPRWDAMGVEPVADLHEVFARAHLLAADNTSVLPEFASLGRPVVWLNAPWWRRDVHHGGRYWLWPQGQVSCDEPEKLAEAVLLGLTDPPSVQEARQRMVESVYVATDGHAAERAVEAIRSVVSISTH